MKSCQKRINWTVKMASNPLSFPPISRTNLNKINQYENRECIINLDSITFIYNGKSRGYEISVNDPRDTFGENIKYQLKIIR